MNCDQFMVMTINMQDYCPVHNILRSSCSWAGQCTSLHHRGEAIQALGHSVGCTTDLDLPAHLVEDHLDDSRRVTNKHRPEEDRRASSSSSSSRTFSTCNHTEPDTKDTRAPDHK